MDQRTPHINRLKVSNAIYNSCLAYSEKDIDLAFRWAIEVIRRSDGLYLNPSEESYLSAVIKKRGDQLSN